MNHKHNNTNKQTLQSSNNKQLLQSSLEQYPISVNNQHCVGPCYYSNTNIIHPITLDEIKGVDHNFCPVNTFVFVDPVTKKSTLSAIDRCFIPTAHKTSMDDLLRDNVIAPQFHFSSDYFVKIYYKINNIEDLLRWIDSHKEDPYKTRERVFNNGMVVYGDQITIIDHRLVDFVNEIMLNNLPKLYRNLSSYIVIQGDIVMLINPNDDKKSKVDNRSNVTIIRNYIKDKFLGINNIQQFMSKFIRYYKEEITNKYVSDILVNHMIDYIIKRIKLTLDNTLDNDTQ